MTIRRAMQRTGMLAAALLATTACSSHGDDPGTLSPQEKSQLDDAAAMLDANSVALQDATANDATGDNQQ